MQSDSTTTPRPLDRNPAIGETGESATGAARGDIRPYSSAALEAVKQAILELRAEAAHCADVGDCYSLSVALNDVSIELARLADFAGIRGDRILAGGRS